METIVKSGQEIRIAAVGDILLSDGYFDIGYGMGSQIKRKGPFYPFENMLDCFDESDLIIGNLECAISCNSPRKGLRAKEFLSSPIVIDSLQQLGFDILLLANNHVLQHGAHVYRETVAQLQKAGIAPVGSRSGHRDREHTSQEIVTRVYGDKTLGFLGYSMVQDEHNPRVKEYAHCDEAGKIAMEVADNRKKCDCLILLLHWGEEFISYPSKEQIETGRRFIDAGADVIIGSHPHVLQGIEMYKGKTIAYSLGNFVFNMPATVCRQSAILKLKIGIDGSQTARLIPVWIDELGRPEIPKWIKRENIEKRIALNDQDLFLDLNGNGEYQTAVKAGLSDHRASIKKQFTMNIHKMEKRLVIKLLYEFMARRFQEMDIRKRASVPGVEDRSS